MIDAKIDAFKSSFITIDTEIVSIVHEIPTINFLRSSPALETLSKARKVALGDLCASYGISTRPCSRGQQVCINSLGYEIREGLLVIWPQEEKEV